ASSTDVERGFSRGGLTVTKKQHAVSDESVRAATVLSSWVGSGIDGLVNEMELLTLFR
ncbi:hypothetical protein OF83DRAFT_1036322, partial [Amylostereum chailletii]